MDVLKSKVVKIRKESYCNICSRRFVAGEKMLSFFIVDGKQKHCGHLCKKCAINNNFKFENKTEAKNVEKVGGEK